MSQPAPRVHRVAPSQPATRGTFPISVHPEPDDVRDRVLPGGLAPRFKTPATFKVAGWPRATVRTPQSVKALRQHGPVITIR